LLAGYLRLVLPRISYLVAALPSLVGRAMFTAEMFVTANFVAMRQAQRAIASARLPRWHLPITKRDGRAAAVTPFHVAQTAYDRTFKANAHQAASLSARENGITRSSPQRVQVNKIPF
jgi:hypothetical protein